MSMSFAGAMELQTMDHTSRSQRMHSSSSSSSHMESSRLTTDVQLVHQTSQNSFLIAIQTSSVVKKLNQFRFTIVQSFHVFRASLNDLKTVELDSASPLLRKHIVLREEIPYERFIFDFNSDSNSSLNKLKLRCISLIHTVEGALRTASHFVEAHAKRFFENRYGHRFVVTSERHFEVLDAQLRGLKYSFKSIFKPFATYNVAQNDDQLGFNGHQMSWGTTYNGERTFIVFGNYDYAR